MSLVLATPAAAAPPANHRPAIRAVIEPVRPAHGWITARAASEAQTRGLVFTSSAQQNVVSLFAKDDPRTPIGQIVDGLNGPQGLATDAGGSLYVANTGNNTVTVYPAGQITPSRTLSVGLSGPFLVGVDDQGYVYVANSGAGVVGFRPGATTPTIKLTLPQASVGGLAVAPFGNVYVGWNVPSSEFTENVYVYGRGSANGRNTGVSVSSDEDPPSAIAIDSLENILVCDDGVAVYPKGSTNAHHYYYGGFDTGIALDRDGRLYVIDQTFGATYQKRYPDGNDLNAIEGGGSSGVAASSKPTM